MSRFGADVGGRVNQTGGDKDDPREDLWILREDMEIIGAKAAEERVRWRQVIP